MIVVIMNMFCMLAANVNSNATEIKWHFTQQRTILAVDVRTSCYYQLCQPFKCQCDVYMDPDWGHHFDIMLFTNLDMFSSTFPWQSSCSFISGSPYDSISNGREISRNLATLEVVSDSREAGCQIVWDIHCYRNTDFSQPNYYWDLLIENDTWQMFPDYALAEPPNSKLQKFICKNRL